MGSQITKERASTDGNRIEAFAYLPARKVNQGTRKRRTKAQVDQLEAQIIEETSSNNMMEPESESVSPSVGTR